MEEEAILQRFTALGHPQRMAVFRLLMRRYPDAVAAGEIAQALGIKPSTLSVYLSALSHAGLIVRHRAGTSRHYRARIGAARGMVAHLWLDCGRGRADLWPRPSPQTRRLRNVLFVCSGNSARSIFAEAILAREGGGRFAAYSAGTSPRARIDPRAAEVLRAHGHDPDPQKPKDIKIFLKAGAPEMDAVITVCDRSANTDGPIWPDMPFRAHWGLPDPVAAPGPPESTQRAFEATYDTLQARIRALVALPCDRLDPVALQHELDALGLKESLA